MPQTQKNDWLNSFLAKQPNMLVSGDISFSLLIDLTPEENVTLRFIANKNNFYAYVLAVQSKFSNWIRIKDTLRSSDKAKNLISRLESSFNKNLHVLIFDDSTKNSFSVRYNNSFIDLDSTRLLTYFETQVSQDIVKNVGSSKLLNKTFNDYFHEWTYINLSKYIVVSDFDAILLEDTITLFELKRIEESVNTWLPYLDEQAIYGSIINICREINGSFWLLAYQVSNEQTIAFHYIYDVSTTAINGVCILINPQELLSNPLNVYNSDRSRQRRSY